MICKSYLGGKRWDHRRGQCSPSWRSWTCLCCCAWRCHVFCSVRKVACACLIIRLQCSLKCKQTNICVCLFVFPEWFKLNVECIFLIWCVFFFCLNFFYVVAIASYSHKCLCQSSNGSMDKLQAGWRLQNSALSLSVWERDSERERELLWIAGCQWSNICLYLCVWRIVRCSSNPWTVLWCNSSISAHICHAQSHQSNLLHSREGMAAIQDCHI